MASIQRIVSQLTNVPLAGKALDVLREFKLQNSTRREHAFNLAENFPPIPSGSRIEQSCAVSMIAWSRRYKVIA